MNAQQTRRVANRDDAHRRAQGDELELLEKLARFLSGEAPEEIEGFSLEGMTLRSERGEDLAVADVVRRAVHLIRSYRGIERAEERLAWDQYASGVSAPSDGAAAYADSLLAHRRRRFSPEHKP
jgi:hypothetical protein